MNQIRAGLPDGGRVAGSALMGAVVVGVVAGLITPGVSLIDPVDQTDLSVALESLAESANLSHVTTLLAMVSMLLYTWGFLGIFKAVREVSGPAGATLRIGIGASIFGWALFSISMGMRHMAIHLMQRSAEEADLAQSVVQVQAASGVFVAMTAILIAFLAVFPIGTLLTGIGLAALVRTVGLGTVAGWGLIVMGAAALVNFHVAMHVTSFDPATMLEVNNLLLAFGALMLFLLGLALFMNPGADSG